MIKAIIFDCFGVLSTEGFGVFRDKYLMDQPQKKEQANLAMDKLNTGNSSYPGFVEELAKLAEVSKEKVRSYLDQNKPNEPLFEYIRNELKPSYKIGMLSNAGEDWIEELFSQKDIALFDDIVLSFRLGVIKPDPKIYGLASQGLAVKPEECVFVDDQTKHCEGAKNAGMQAIWYQSFEQFKTDIEKLLSAKTDN